MKRLMTLIFTLMMSFCVSAQLCTNDHRFTNVPFFTDAQISSQQNVTYADVVDWQGNNETLEFDVYYPTLTIDTLALRPLIFMVHGGGLVSGDKINYTRVCKEFAMRGFVAVTINYRLGLNCASDTLSEEKAKYRAQQDINAAFRYISQNAALLRVDTTWMFIGGGSAGSVASLGVVYISQSEWNNFTPSLQPLLGNLNNSGNNLTNTYSIKGVFNDWGAMLKTSMQQSEMLPMVSFHGEADSTVVIDSSLGGGCVHVDKSYGSRAMHNLLLSNGVCSDLSVRPNGGHGVYQDSLVGVPFRVGRAACFFKSLFCNNCVSNYQTDSIPADCNLTLRLTENEINNVIQVNPNPFSDKLTISNFDGTEMYLLLNQLGQLIYKGNQIQEQNFEKLKSGIYFLTITTQNNIRTYKLIKRQLDY